MSGRARHLRDGELITNRKTDRRQSAPRSKFELAFDADEACAKKYPTQWRVRIGFFLPTTILVSDGEHKHGVAILKGFAQVRHGSATECFVSASEFLADVAKGHPSFSRLVVIRDTHEHEGRGYYRAISVVNGAMVVSSATIEPQVYGDRAA